MFNLDRVSTRAGLQPATLLRKEDFHMFFSRSVTARAEKFFVEPIHWLRQLKNNSNTGVFSPQVQKS